MFRKAYKVKTSTTIKGSDRRKLRSVVESQFPSISMEDLNSLIPSKGEMNQVKASTHSDCIVMIFYSCANPVFFQYRDIYYPTIYTLWKFPNLLPTITVVSPALDKISNGADLMAPGIIVNESSITKMRDLKKGDICALKVMGNAAPLAVGTALMTAEELCVEGVKGKAVSIVHVFSDQLFLSGDQQKIPSLQESDVEELSTKINETVISDEESTVQEVSSSEISNTETTVNQNLDNSDPVLEKEESIPEYSMDDVLLHSFLTAVKVSGKKIELPILTSKFYGTYVLKSCPSALNLDIKKTSYKKVSVFLKKMQKDGIVHIKELSKGVDSVTAINVEHASVTTYTLEPIFVKHLKEEKEKIISEDVPSDSIQASYKFPMVTELYVITAQVKELFSIYKISKGEVVPPTTIRDVIKRYVKENSLQNEQNPKEIILDPILTDCACKKGESRSVMTWESLFEGFISKMTHAYQVQFENEDPVVKKGKLEPILVSVDTRTGNKKVTLIQNLETYGIKPKNLAQHVQVAVAASTSITPTQSGKGTLVLIQGNQVRYLQTLFLDIYKVPRKYIQGLENVPKKK